MSGLWVSYSTLTTHRVCPQRWNYKSLRGLRKDDPEDITIERDFGSWWHALRAADAIVRGRLHDSICWVPEHLSTTDAGPKISTGAVSKDLVLAAAAEWWHKQTGTVQMEWGSRLGGTLEERLRALDYRWSKVYERENLTERPLAVELKWTRDLPPLPDGTDADTTVIGYVDEVYLDTKRNLVVARDHKTHKALGKQTASDDLMDSQLQVYAWGASPTVSEWGNGSIRAVAYDRVRSVKPKEPQITQSGALSKSVTDYDAETYVEWSSGGVEFPGRKKDGSGAGVYLTDPAVVAALSSPAARSAWFQRTLSPLNANVVRAHLRSAVDTALDMRASRERVEVNGAAARNFGANCRYCDFVALCRAEMIGGTEGTEYDLADFKLVHKKARGAPR